MFLLNSRLGLFSAAYLRRHSLLLTYGVNLPSSLTTLFPLVLGFSPHLPVSVCGTGTLVLTSSFSCQCGIGNFGTYFPSISRLRNVRRTSLPDYLLRLCMFFQLHALPILLRPCLVQTNYGGMGISTHCPSTTPFGLALGPDLPWADEPSPGNLRFSTVKILTLLSLLIPAFSLLIRPHVLTIMLLPTSVSSPTKYTYVHFQSFGT